MRQEEVNRQKEKDPSLVIPMRAACKHCGQITSVEVLLSWGTNEAEELATELCNCDAAREETLREKNREKAKEKIQQIFTDPEFEYHLDEIMEPEIKEQLVPTLNFIIDAVSSGIIRGCTCDIGKGIKAVIKRNSNGSIKIQRTMKSDTSFLI